MTRNYYVRGNTVRELEVPVRRERRSKEELEEISRRKRRKNAARRNRARAMGMNRAYVAFLSMCVMAVAAAAVMLVQLQSQVSARMRRVSALQSDVNDQRAENDARYKSIITSVDLNQIRDVAVNELGMSYPTEEQVVYYTVDNNNFMDQYSDIPRQ
ncbi:MAG: hypothetical protein NC180_05765 [Muribaculaceae bacterium]|nr:hypothetical protein [Roseburia sp.]MCM1430605.1 hypothetical protein [Muribaculaceae bacterium]MCM1492712.1 hypothetical protein [Muribaculaceae bacterium]